MRLQSCPAARAPEFKPAVEKQRADGVTPASFPGTAGQVMGRTPINVTQIEQIIDEHVKLGNRQALEFLLTHRRRLAVDLKGRAGSDFSLPIDQIDQIIALIEAGLDRLRTVRIAAA
jgi:hypothetical protein